MKILEITFKGWLRLWRTLLETVVSIVLGLLVVVFRGIVKGTVRCYRELVKATAEHPKGALAGFAMGLILVWLMTAARGWHREAGDIAGRGFNLPRLRFTPKRRPL